MNNPWRYAITLPGPPGGHAPSRVVTVEFTGEHSADGNPVYADVHTGLRVEIHDGATKVLGPLSGAGPRTCLHAVPVS
ncbi:DUF6296 family protein [Kitasatospora cinereorecta]|uniref:DUF6296 family protein n=1 Tax=Kitasatospora cinereorecta TaxID=285560 RepID=A0ABW0VKI3_9ACTN